MILPKEALEQIEHNLREGREITYTYTCEFTHFCKMTHFTISCEVTHLCELSMQPAN